MNLSFRDLSTLGKLYIVLLTFMVVVGTIYMLIVMNVDRKSDKYPINESSIYSSEGILTLREIYNNEYWLYLNSNGSDTIINCYLGARMPNENSGCRIPSEKITLIQGKEVTVHWYRVPKLYWYHNPYKQLISISADDEVIYQISKGKNQLLVNVGHAYIILALLIGNILMFFVIRYFIKSNFGEFR
ncbi:hypothetical protein [Psychrobacter sp. 219-2-C]|uniref:hypothetical protein n=1 Tax=Psychrobacter sp. 219-2-C TaxID=3414707 RepID=UPI003C6DE64E